MFRELPGAGAGLFSITAYLLKDGQVGFWSSGNAPSALSVSPASGPPAVGVFRGSYPSGAVAVLFYGYAHENVTRVVLRLGDGRQYSVQALAAWPGSRLRLWFLTVPTEFLRIDPGKEVMRGYDASGQVVWQQRVGAGS